MLHEKNERRLTFCRIGMQLHDLTRVLDEMNIQWEWVKSNLAYSERLPGDLRKIIRGVDFVIGVFMGDRAGPRLMHISPKKFA